MAVGYVQVPPDSTGKKLATESWTQGSDTVHGQKLLVADASGNVVGVSSNRLDVNIPSDQTIKLRGSHADTVSSRKTGFQSTPVLDVRLVEDTVGNAIGQGAGTPIYTTPAYSANFMYSFSTAELTMATATGVKEILTIFKANTVSENVFLLKLNWYPTGTPITAGRAVFENQYITAENGTPGGTAVTPQTLNRGITLPANINLRAVVTGAPTTTGQVFGRIPLLSFPNTTGTLPAIAQPVISTPIWDATTQGPIMLRGGQTEGLRVTLNVLATLTGAQTGYLSGILLVTA